MLGEYLIMEEQLNKYYVYVYIDPLTMIPFYIGKGSKNRCNSHLNEAKSKVCKSGNKHKFNKILQLLEWGLYPIIIKIRENLSLKEASFLEEIFIDTIGRKDLGTGPLTNLTSGGEGSKGRIQTEECKNKISNARMGITLIERYGEIEAASIKKKIARPGELNGMYGRKRTISEKEHLSKCFKGVIPNRNYKHYFAISPNGSHYYFNWSLSEFCKQHNLSYFTVISWLNRGTITLRLVSGRMTEAGYNTEGWEFFTVDDTDYI